MQATELKRHLNRAVDAIRSWEQRFGPFPASPAGAVDEEVLLKTFDAYAERLTGNYPFFHPAYAGQMLKPPHPVAIVGYLAAMLINPNNHALDGGPPTSEMEKEVVRQLASMFGFPDEALGHLTSSGTIANLEAVWIARELAPDRAIAVSDQAHYTHTRLGELLRTEIRMIPSDEHGKIRLDELERALQAGEIGTVVLTAGTTGFGAMDPIADVVPWRDRYGIRVHVDAAYGGFFKLLADDPEAPLEAETQRHLHAIAACDSVVVDPHKHGLQPYGCGCILFRDPSVGRVYRHDSPYTYFTSDELHLGEISFECSRAGAAAGALWLTLQMIPLEASRGFGPILSAGLRACRGLAARLETSDRFRVYMAPELDILTYFPEPGSKRLSQIDLGSQEVFDRGMSSQRLFLSTIRVGADHFCSVHPDLQRDAEEARILRSVLMKPEHEAFVDTLYARLVEAAEGRS